MRKIIHLIQQVKINKKLIFIIKGNNQNDNKIRIFSSSIANFNPNPGSGKVDIIRNSEMGKLDSMRAKLISNPSAGNLFEASMKRDNSSKIIYKNVNRKTGSEKSKENVSNDSIHTRNDIVIKRNNSNINIGEYMRNSIIKSKITSKVANNKNYKN